MRHQAATRYPPTSAEFKSRDQFDFILAEGENWSDTNICAVRGQGSREILYIIYLPRFLTPGAAISIRV